MSGTFKLQNKKTLIMGILNVTPDSFSDGGRFVDLSKAVGRAAEMEAEGADILDIGGESTRPNYTPVAPEEEMRRVIPVIEAIRSKSNIPISIDTSKAVVAEAAIKAGASFINDVWGFKADPHMAHVASRYQCPCCLMHNRQNRDYGDIVATMLKDLEESVEIALNAGVKKENIYIDPGIGFAKTYEQNLEVLARLEEFHSLGYPILLGVSRKSVIGNTLELPVNERVEGTLATTVYGIMKGVSIVRVHDVKENARAAKMVERIMKSNPKSH